MIAKSRILVAVALLTSLALLRVPAQAQIPAPSLAAPVLVSGPTPYKAGCDGAADPTGKAFPGGVVEPSIAIDPTDPSHLVAAWQQDRRSDGGAQGQQAAYSHDSGRTWTGSAAHFTHCQGGNAINGGDYERASDPWVEIAANGDVYQSSLVLNTTSFTSAIAVSRSSDGGATWSDPVPIILDDMHLNFNDKETMAVDPNAANVVYATWDRITKAAPAASFEEVESSRPGDSGPAMFSRSTDGGKTWEPARPIFDPGTNAQTVGNQVLVLPDGALVETMTIVRSEGRQDTSSIAAIRSTDGGDSWSDPVTITGPSTSAKEPDEPRSGMPIRSGTGEEVDYAVDPGSGALYAVWSERGLSGGSRVDLALSTSVDGGRSWSAPVRIDQTPNDAPAFAPAVAVLPDGTVGISYYDLRNDSPYESAIATDYWFESCRSGCTERANWNEVHIAGPFDLRPAPFAGALFLGDYEGLAGGPRGFALLFSQTHSSLSERPTDIYYTLLSP